MQLLQLNSLELMKAVLAGQYKIINIPFYWSGETPEVKTWHRTVLDKSQNIKYLCISYRYLPPSGAMSLIKIIPRYDHGIILQYGRSVLL